MNDSTSHENEFVLRQRLRALPRERTPEIDLWPGIAARLAPRSPARLRRWRWQLPVAVAMAASLAVAALWLPHLVPHAPMSPYAAMMQREADAMAREYGAAMDQLGPVPEALRPAALELDRNVQALRVALDEQPEATYLLVRLRSAYAQRLRLGQRHVLG